MSCKIEHFDKVLSIKYKFKNADKQPKGIYGIYNDENSISATLSNGGKKILQGKDRTE